MGNVSIKNHGLRRMISYGCLVYWKEMGERLFEIIL